MSDYIITIDDYLKFSTSLEPATSTPDKVELTNSDTDDVILHNLSENIIIFEPTKPGEYKLELNNETIDIKVIDGITKRSWSENLESYNSEEWELEMYNELITTSFPTESSSDNIKSELLTKEELRDFHRDLSDEEPQNSAVAFHVSTIGNSNSGSWFGPIFEIDFSDFETFEFYQYQRRSLSQGRENRVRIGSDTVWSESQSDNTRWEFESINVSNYTGIKEIAFEKRDTQGTSSGSDITVYSRPLLRL